MKMDIEGFEFRVLNHFYRTQPHIVSKVDLIEDNPTLVQEGSIHSLLQRHGYKVARDFGLNKLYSLAWWKIGNSGLQYSPQLITGQISFRVFDSLKLQTFRNFEWLIIDDGSTDDTKTLVEEYQRSANFVIRYYFRKTFINFSHSLKHFNWRMENFFILLIPMMKFFQLL